MQHYKHACKNPLQPHYEPFDIMGGDKRYRLISSVLAAFAAGQSRPD